MASVSVIDTTDLDLDLDDIELDAVEIPAAAAAARANAPQPAPATPRRAPSQESIVYFDLETVPDFSRLDSFGLPPLPVPRTPKPALECPPLADVLGGTLDSIKRTIGELQPDDEWLDALLSAELLTVKPRKGVADAVADLRAERERCTTAAAERNKLLSCTPEFCRIVAIGLATDSEAPRALLAQSSSDDCERELLNEFWRSVDRGICRAVCGYNVANFDLPVLLIRSAILGVEPRRFFDLKPWGSRDVLDLMAMRFGRGKPAKLKELCRWLGIVPPAGDCDGSQVLRLWQSDPATLAEYVRSDVWIVQELYRRLQGYFWV